MDLTLGERPTVPTSEDIDLCAGCVSYDVGVGNSYEWTEQPSHGPNGSWELTRDLDGVGETCIWRKRITLTAGEITVYGAKNCPGGGQAVTLDEYVVEAEQLSATVGDVTYRWRVCKAYYVGNCDNGFIVDDLRCYVYQDTTWDGDPGTYSETDCTDASTGSTLCSCAASAGVPSPLEDCLTGDIAENGTSYVAPQVPA